MDAQFGPGGTGAAAIVAGEFTLAGPGSGVGWAGAGTLMQRLLSSPGRVRAFNVTMAGPVGGLLAVMATE